MKDIYQAVSRLEPGEAGGKFQMGFSLCDDTWTSLDSIIEDVEKLLSALQGLRSNPRFKFHRARIGSVKKALVFPIRLARKGDIVVVDLKTVKPKDGDADPRQEKLIK